MAAAIRPRTSIEFGAGRARKVYATMLEALALPAYVATGHQLQPT